MDFHRPVEEDFWWEVAQACDYATFFHSPLWHRLAEKTFDEYEDRTVGAVTEDGVRMVLPLLKTGESARGVMDNLISTFAGCYGGVISDGEVSKEKILEIYKKANSLRIAEMRVNGNPYFKKGLPEIGNATKDFTQVLNLNKGMEHLLSKYDKDCIKKIEEGKNNNIRLRKAVRPSDVYKYYEIYQDNIDHWKDVSIVYPVSLFETIFKDEKISNNSTLWLAERGGEVIGGTLVFYFNKHSVEWHAVFDREYFSIGVRNYTVNEIIKKSIRKGMSIYDFNPSGGYSGVVNFKSKFGAEKKYFNRLNVVDKKVRLVRSIKNKRWL
ncbi:hypothetical protein GGQ02_003114 [Salinibacter ruber]|uniref:GNAT family N-acetyltransferase n=1 Tax=Salinibacter ruber TaxID=146919 RepID=UPI00216A4C5B|nr:GNAT family N-acetyltransferase [Salinibacter ruber]MCS4034704.1 hypothetical protein [Salinibacter ruber]